MARHRYRVGFVKQPVKGNQMKMPEFVTKSCDACGDFFEVEQWFADRSGMQLCDDCAEDMREAAEVMQNGGRA